MSTIREVAAAAGVSIAAVSLAYHQPHRLKPNTRLAILRAAQKLGYRPNLAASLLWSRNPGANNLTRKMGIAFITAEQTPEARRGQTLFQTAAQARSEQLGYGFERYDLKLSAPPKNFISILRSRGVVGVIFGPNYYPQLLKQIDWEGFAGVCLGGYPAPAGFHRVRSDPFLQVTMAWNELCQRGYRRIGAVLFHHKPWLNDDHLRLGAYLAGQVFKKVPKPIPPLVGSPPESSAFDAWFTRYQPDAIIDFNSGSLENLIRLNRKIPEDCALVTLYDVGQPPGQIAQVREDYDTIGSAAVGTLDQLLRHHEIGPRLIAQDVRIPPRWIEGKSVAPLANASTRP